MDLRALLALPLFLSVTPLAAQCRLCMPESGLQPGSTKATDARPLAIEVETALDFSRAAGTGNIGSIAIDERTGARQVAGLTDLGGFALKGSVRLTGEPFRHVRVSLPPSVRLVSPNGSSAEAVDLRTDLPPNPMLDASGTLRFTFGGRLVLSGSAAGEFRGRIPIVADYQ
jgi:hypothetical protein